MQDLPERTARNIRKGERGLTPKALVIALLLIPLNVFWIIQLEVVRPAVPYLPVKRQNIHQYFTGRPWNAMGGVRLSFYPFAIGISFLIPLDLLFSCWVFYWVYKFELMAGSILGVRNLPGYPYADAQSFGAYMVLLGTAAWVGRSHIKQIFAGVAVSSSLTSQRLSCYIKADLKPTDALYHFSLDSRSDTP